MMLLETAAAAAAGSCGCPPRAAVRSAGAAAKQRRSDSAEGCDRQHAQQTLRQQLDQPAAARVRSRACRWSHCRLRDAALLIIMLAVPHVSTYRLSGDQQRMVRESGSPRGPGRVICRSARLCAAQAWQNCPTHRCDHLYGMDHLYGIDLQGGMVASLLPRCTCASANAAWAVSRGCNDPALTYPSPSLLGRTQLPSLAIICIRSTELREAPRQLQEHFVIWLEKLLHDASVAYLWGSIVALDLHLASL